MFGNMSGWHLLILLAVVILLFGAARLPALSKSVGQSIRIFRSGTKSLKDDSGNTPKDHDREPSSPSPALSPQGAVSDEPAR